MTASRRMAEFVRQSYRCNICCTLLVISVCGQHVQAQQTGWPDPIAGHVVPFETSGMTHGPLLGQLTANSVRVWIRTQQPTEFEVIFGTSLPLDADSRRVTGTTTVAADLTGTVSLTGLVPDTTYYYGVRINEQLADLRFDIPDPWPRFRTLPDTSSRADIKNPQGLFNVTFAVGHCASQDPVRSGGQYVSTPALATILREHRDEVMFTIVNGDIIYEEERDGTLDGVRSNYRLYFSRGRSFAALFRQVPAFFTFDDHDVGWDIHGCGQVGMQAGPHLIRDIGLRAYTEYAAWANPRGPQSGRIRFGEGQVRAGSNVLVDADAAFDILDPTTVSTIHLGNYTRDSESVRRKENPLNSGVYGLQRVIDKHRIEITPAATAEETISYSIGTHHYYDWKVSNCHFFALDTRGERSNRNPRDRYSDKLFILGETQRNWLMDGIRQSDAQFIFLISPDPWTIFHTAAHVSDAPEADKDDKGDGFPSFVHEREILLSFLDSIPKPVLIFTGDVHASASVRITDNVWEMMCGPLGSTGHPLGTLGNPPLGGAWNSQGRDVNIRWVSGFPNNMPYQRIRNTYYGIVQINNVLQSGRPDTPGYQWSAYDAPQVVVRWHDGYTGRLAYAESITTADAVPPP
jgi:alkaline phosphatase D